MVLRQHGFSIFTSLGCLKTIQIVVSGSTRIMEIRFLKVKFLGYAVLNVELCFFDA
jgi:hypothetical protein